MTGDRNQVTRALPANHYNRDPLAILIDKENSIENRIKGCKGCKHLSFDASGERIFATCDRDRKVGRKGKCTLWKETE